MILSYLNRLGRKMYMLARGDSKSSLAPEKNGEYWLIEKVMERMKTSSVFLDIGANKGDWSAKVLESVDAQCPPFSVYAFEPSSFTRDLLSSRFVSEDRIIVSDCALSDAAGKAQFFVGKPGAGTNSLHQSSGTDVESIEVSTLDLFLQERDISQVIFAKIDTEGFDALVLAGALECLQRGVFDLIQFEYNWRWLLNSKSLRDIFQLIRNTPYSLGKLAGNKVLVFEDWHFELDRFFENNYVLIKKDGLFDGLGVSVIFDKTNSMQY